jgi:hypothetical protein
MPAGPLPTLAVPVTRFVFGSTRTTVLAASSETQTDPAPTAMPRPTACVRILATTSPLAGAIRMTSSSAESVTQTDPNPYATAVTPWPT